MPKKIDYVKRAWNEIGFEVPAQYSTKEKIADSVSDLKNMVSDIDEKIAAYKDELDNLKTHKEKAKDLMSDLELVQHQIKVERSKELNKDMPIKEIF